jgi:3-hydroxybutyryl-CoA dehydrogenase
METQTTKDFTKWKVVIIGAGVMGVPLTQHFATHGCSTVLCSRTISKLDEALRQIQGNLKAMKSANLLPGAVSTEEIMGHIETSDDLESALKNANIVFECVPEEASIKQEIFYKMDKYAPEDAFLCSDTSALNIYELVSVSHPERLLITHFFNPPNVMPLVEVVKGPDTSEKVVDRVKEFLEFVEKKPIIMEKCIPGFIFNRLLTALEREALYIVELEAATFQDIDTVITTTFGPRFTFEGIFRLLDHVGIDTEAAVVGDLLKELCDDKKPSSILLKKSKEGEHGLKKRKGFYDYEGVDLDDLRNKRTINILNTLEHMKCLK